MWCHWQRSDRKSRRCTQLFQKRSQRLLSVWPSTAHPSPREALDLHHPNQYNYPQSHQSSPWRWDQKCWLNFHSAGCWMQWCWEWNWSCRAASRYISNEGQSTKEFSPSKAVGVHFGSYPVCTICSYQRCAKHYNRPQSTHSLAFPTVVSIILKSVSMNQNQLTVQMVNEALLTQSTKYHTLASAILK